MAALRVDAPHRRPHRRDLRVRVLNYSNRASATFEHYRFSGDDIFELSLALCRYLAPEYFMHGLVDEKTDVFAFGVLLLEIVSGRKPVDGSHQSLLSWVSALPNFGSFPSFPAVLFYPFRSHQSVVACVAICKRAPTLFSSPPHRPRKLEPWTRGFCW